MKSNVNYPVSPVLSRYIFHLLCISLIIGFFTGCSKEEATESQANDVWDVDKKGIPEFVATNYIELDDIYRISKFRSAVGHDYSDAFEDCRSMKHYYEPRNDVDWSLIKIFSPVNGKITRIEEEWAGTKIEIAADVYPAFRFSVFHINPITTWKIDDKVSAGQQLGTHIGIQTMSDIAVTVNDPTRQGKMVSYFDVMTDALFMDYTNRGISTREEMIITKEVRDDNPLVCAGDTFISTDSLENWIILN
jgi:hypothetical protein